MSKQVISNIIPEVCTALCIELKDYVKLPKTSDDWLKISKYFQDTWNLPHCVGAIDGKHIVLQAPIHSGTEFHNYKSFFSIVLFALVGGNCNFLFVDIGRQGRISDGGIFKSSQLWTMIQNASLNLPPSQTLPNRQINIPYFFVGDSAFTLHENVMILYRGNHVMGSKERIFNYRLSRARRNVENAFGIISAVFRVLRKPMLLEPKKAELIVLTTVYLHNCLRSNSTDYKLQILNNTEETTPLTYFLPLRQIPIRSASHVKKFRDEIADYCIKEGKAEWQQGYA